MPFFLRVFSNDYRNVVPHYSNPLKGVSLRKSCDVEFDLGVSENEDYGNSTRKKSDISSVLVLARIRTIELRKF
jgi:hypothetical protein